MKSFENGSPAPAQKPGIGPTPPKPNKTFGFSVDGTMYQTNLQFMTGREIKHLAHVPDEFDLYLIVPGYQDEMIGNDATVNFARPGVERFESRKPHQGQILIVNTRQVAYEESMISYEQVVSLAGYDLHKPDRGYTVTYEDGPHQNPQGGLSKGHKVFVKHLMQFHVNATDKS